MDIGAWSYKEKFLSAFWLACAGALLVNLVLAEAEMDLVDRLQHASLLSLALGAMASPRFFLTPLKTQFRLRSAPSKPLVVGLLAFFFFQLLATFSRLAGS
ncbi:hypothetical protein M2262_003458 [Pseudomonas sp. BIGb0408]|uniref:Uncharacterized protein n=1 Tax=Phytopseudomonas flavescens TaxID=29435 RepID=A0A7Z0BPD8_9GAMM|nr:MULTISPECIES: hypothetical protein [Pseudomonas]MCW2293408.1 hypothetical protein [Pseudomonas sp. BIGb0408]NYH72021.1 hypothetical protein [Pseudomonas flavescens]